MHSTQDPGLICNLHCIAHARPTRTEERLVTIADRQYRAVDVPTHEQSLPMEVAFEEALTSLGQHPGCHTEPDGWFIWSGHHRGQAWSLQGQMTDDGVSVLFVELKGDCPQSTFETLEGLFSTARPLIFQIPREGIFLERDELLRWFA